MTGSAATSGGCVSHATPEDREAWQRLYRAYAAFYDVRVSQEVLDAVWGWIRDDGMPFYCLLARDQSGVPIALMHYREMPSPLRGARVGFLDDLFVDPAFRGTGVVEALFVRLRQESAARGWPLVRWITRDDNYRARRVYDKLAAKTDWITYQLDV